MNKSPGTAGQAVVNEIASWTEAELDAMIAKAVAPTEIRCAECGNSVSVAHESGSYTCLRASRTYYASHAEAMAAAGNANERRNR